jgi:hypothetical protein
MLPPRVTSLTEDIKWPSRSSDLIACEFILWGYFKSRQDEKRPGTMDDLKKEHHGRSGSKFSHHAVKSDAEFSEIFAGNKSTTMEATTKTLYTRCELL